MSETKGARQKIDQMTGNLVRSGSSPDYARAVTLDAARRADRGAVKKRAKGKPSRAQMLKEAQAQASQLLKGPPKGKRIEVRDWMNGAK
jgi:hypothetical protein